MVDFASRLYDSRGLRLLIWLVVVRQTERVLAAFTTQDCSTVSHIRSEAQIVHKKCDYGTAATSVQHVVPACRKLLHRIQKVHFAFLEAIHYGLSRVLGKFRIPDNELVEIVSEEVSTRVASMTIEDGEEGALGPSFALFLRWLLHVQHN